MTVQDTCQQCGQTDDHPKHHYARAGEEVQTHHFDCIPFSVLQDVTHRTEHHFDPDERRFRVVGRTPIAADDLDEHKTTILRAREQALKGKHGDELRAWIVKNGPQATED